MAKQRVWSHLKRMQRKEGVVLIAVLRICALVMWFTLQVGTLVRLQGEDQLHLFRRAQAHYLAIGGGYEALARMGQQPPSGLERGPDLSWQPNGAEHGLKYQTGEAVVSIALETTKINVNSANPEQMREVLIAAGLHEYAAEELADVIADFVDPDDLKRLHGMEARDYQRRGLPYGPFNGPLLTLDQMLLIPGITEQLLYGYRGGGEDTEEGGSEASYNPMLPRKDSLFEMLSVYGTNTALPNPDFEEEIEKRIITWQSGGIYRIYSTGMAYNGPPAVTICLIVRFAPETKHGYEILSRKIM
jgi:general secretion pathway protein K